jgi:hypothetical protein
MRILVRINLLQTLIQGISKGLESTMRDGHGPSTMDSQITHKLSRGHPVKYVDNLLIKFMLQRCNDLELQSIGLYGRGFLPTMKFQLSQLPIDCWFRARQHTTRPFFCALTLSINHLKLPVDESHQKFFDHCAH